MSLHEDLVVQHSIAVHTAPPCEVRIRAKDVEVACKTPFCMKVSYLDFVVSEGGSLVGLFHCNGCGQTVALELCVLYRAGLGDPTVRMSAPRALRE